MTSSLGKPIAAAIALVVLGAIGLVAFRACISDELQPAVILISLWIGIGMNLAAEALGRRRACAVIASIAVWACSLAGHSTIQLLERNAVAADYDLRALSRPDLFIAMEADRISEAAPPTSRGLTSAARREDYDDATWRAATAAWNARTDLDREAIQRDVRKSFEAANESMASRFVDMLLLFLLPDYLGLHAFASLVAAVIVAAERGRPA
jgi:hypothetical protein